MGIDKEVEEAVYDVMRQRGQSEVAAERMLAWLKDMSRRELDRDEKYEHLEMLRKALKLEV